MKEKLLFNLIRLILISLINTLMIKILSLVEEQSHIMVKNAKKR
tara:strand:+ start:298 stop:429 length:132 start_codon:yes stop_codon:yes gene_type:complete